MTIVTDRQTDRQNACYSKYVSFTVASRGKTAFTGRAKLRKIVYVYVCKLSAVNKFLVLSRS